MESYPHIFSLDRPRDANERPPDLPRTRNHPLHGSLSYVQKVVVAGALVEEKGGHASLAVGVERRLIKQEVVSCARHAKSKEPK